MLRELFSRKNATPATADDLSRTANENQQSIRLGDLVKDRIGGKQGTAIERHYHLNGCEFIRVEVSDDEDKNGNFPIQRLELVESRPQFHRDDETMNGSHVKLGDKVKDKLSGFTGHVIIWVVPLFGSHRVIVDPMMKTDGTFGDAAFFDECRLELITAKDPPKATAAKRKTATERGAVGGSMKRQTVSRKAPR